MNICVVCKRVFDPPKDYPEKRTCSKECYAIHMRSLVSNKFLKNSFKKGNVPFNKGIARNEWMPEKSIEKCKEKYHLFYKNNFELSSRGKKIWASYIVFEGNSEKFIKEIENKVNDSKEDIKYSTESIVIGIINKSVYKQNELLNKKNAFVIYGGDIEKFLISTMHTIEEFKIIA